MKTYKITFNLQTPISFLERPTFDGLLAFCYAKELLQDKFAQKLSYDEKEHIDFSEMPLITHKKGYSMSSSMFLGKSEEFTERWRKRWDNRNDFKADFGKRLRKVQITKAEFKSYDMPYPLSAIPKVWFFFQTENTEKVKYLISEHLAGIGKKVNYGNGIIKDFKIEESDFNFNSIFRPIPKNMATSGMMLNSKKVVFNYCAWKPPYWDTNNFAECVLSEI